jgi:alpha-ketoglutarate-dependent taurine dioxygenase
VPRLTSPQLAAMAELDRLDNDPGLVLTMDLRPGDMQFLNNHVTMYSRTEYHDHPDPARRRDLIRLWLDGQDHPAVRNSLSPAPDR